MIFYTAIGFILIIISFLKIKKLFSSAVWRFPLLEIDFILLEKHNSNIKKGGVNIFKRQKLYSIFFNIFIFSIGSLLIFKNLKWMSIMPLIASLWIISAIFKILISMYSKKTRLINYLYSPYLHAWRRDHLSKYSDKQIEIAICIACGIDYKEIVNNDMNLEEFLLILCKKTRSAHEYEKYSESLKASLEQAESLKWLG